MNQVFYTKIREAAIAVKFVEVKNYKERNGQANFNLNVNLKGVIVVMPVSTQLNLKALISFVHSVVVGDAHELNKTYDSLSYWQILMLIGTLHKFEKQLKNVARYAACA